MNLKLYCCYTASHAGLFEDHFKPSVPPGCQIEAIQLDKLQTSGDFAGTGYFECLRQKIRLVIESLASGGDEIVVWSDVDIIFLRDDMAGDLRGRLEKTGCDALFQREGKGQRNINGGFYALKANERSAAFFRAALALLDTDPDMIDQDAINQLLHAGPALRWDFLPFTYYARTHGWPPPRDIILYHANETLGAGGVRRKVRQFAEVHWVRRYGWPAMAWSCLLRIPKRLRGMTRRYLARRAM